MEQRPRIFDILKDCVDATADQALVAAALEVDPTYRRDIVTILLDRGTEAGLRALPALFDLLEPDVQVEIIGSASRLSSALRACIRNSRCQTRLNTLEIIRRSGILRLAYLASLAIHDGSLKVRANAAITLQELARRHCGNYADTTAALRDATSTDGGLSHAVAQTLRLLRDERKHLVTAIREALLSYESHHRPEVVEAAMYLADEVQDSLFQQSTLTRGKLTHATLEIFTGSLSPGLVPFAYVALCYSELRRRVIAVLSSHQDPEFLAEFIRQRWLTRDPSIRKNLVAIRSLAWFSDGLEAAFSLPDDAAAMAPAWLLSLGLPSDQKVSLLLNFLLIENLPANRAAVLALIKIKTPASTLALQSVLDHESPDLVRLASREIEYRQHRERRIQRKPPTNRPGAWSEMLIRAGLTEDFDDFWQHSDRLHPVQAKVAGRHALEFVPGLMTQVQVKLLSTHVADRLRALRLIMALQLMENFQKDIFAITNDKMPEVRATAMTALGHIGGATGRRILERALRDDEPAVQASAIDALDALGFKHLAQVILPKTDSEAPSVRAAAIRVLLKRKLPQAAAAMISMLKDQRADHRCAALWIVDQLRLVSVAPKLAELEQKDEDPRIARIAQHVRKRLQRAQHGIGRERPVPVAGGRP